MDLAPDPSSAQPAEPSTRPLVVDLNDTLVATDTWWESILLLAKTQPWAAASLPAVLLRGKAQAKRFVAERVELDPGLLPYREDVLDFLHEARGHGRRLVLATSSDRLVAEPVAQHLILFDDVLASDGETDLAGETKLAALRERLGGDDFDYMGNGGPDLAIWKATGRAWLVAATPRTARLAEEVATIVGEFHAPPGRVRAGLRAARVHQWVKNVLVFIPLAMAHELGDASKLWLTITAFLAFGMCASAGYILNDLLDLDSDRRHGTKRGRPFASGELPISTGTGLMAALVAVALALTLAALPWSFLWVLASYLLATAAYSLLLKTLPILDVLVLAGLYTTRLLAGGTATDTPLSPWLLGFAIFFFLSLAFLKRYSELRVADERSLPSDTRRGYELSDLPLLGSMGTGTGFVAVLVLALYINSEQTAIYYEVPQFLWGTCVLMLYWVSRFWLLAHRGEVRDDPILFTVRDPASWVVGALLACTLLAATAW